MHTNNHFLPITNFEELHWTSPKSIIGAKCCRSPQVSGARPATRLCAVGQAGGSGVPPSGDSGALIPIVLTSSLGEGSSSLLHAFKAQTWAPCDKNLGKPKTVPIISNLQKGETFCGQEREMC